MADTAYKVIKDFINTKLNTIAGSGQKIEVVYDDPKQKASGYPAALIIPAAQESDYQSSNQNQRIYSFQVNLVHEIQNTGLAGALDALGDLADDVLDLFDKDETLTGIQALLPTGYTMVAVRPARAGWQEDEDRKLVFVNIKINVVLSVSLS